MDKSKRKKLFDELAENGQVIFIQNLPMDETQFPRLFDFMDEKLSERVCNNDFAIASIFIEDNLIEKGKIFDWFYENGVGCDCEILNLEDHFSYLYSQDLISEKRPPAQNRKIKELKTDFGFQIEMIPSPWILFETISDETIYSFYLGKSKNCLVTLNRNFPVNKLIDTQYWLDLWIKDTNLSIEPNELTLEHSELNQFSIILVKSKGWTPVLIWCKPKISEEWFLKVQTEVSRYKGDLKELSMLLSAIKLHG